MSGWVGPASTAVSAVSAAVDQVFPASGRLGPPLPANPGENLIEYGGTP
jgi:hypothetical protein